MLEPVRLVVWDLDGTFWTGTLTEGGHTYSDANHNIIIELARRGIVSSICSKNDYETIKPLLIEKGIWDYIVFPSINWNPKGARLKQLVEDVQLRPETILFLDDNPLNLREAEHFVPGIQTASDSFIPQILDSPLFKGKDDRNLSRLAQYKLLQTRKADEADSTDNAEFLRSCDIRVTIEHHIDNNIDRAIELVNRTNQLNFTKNRLPEDADRARRKLRASLNNFDVQAGLIRVTDRYGDYGYCGFYMTKTRKGRSRLRHFCFSCRILNMGVENWVYQRLGKPKLEVVGEVLTDLTRDLAVDWINTAPATTTKRGEGKTGAKISRVMIRGACTVSPLVHYFKMDASEVVGEFNEVRDGIQLRTDHSLMLRYAIERPSEENMEALQALGFEAADFNSKFFEVSKEPALRILSNWVDWQGVLYRNKRTGLLVPYKVKKIARLGDVAAKSDQHFEDLPPRAREALRYLRDNFEFAGALSGDEADRTLDIIVDALPQGSPLFVITAPETGMGAAARAIELNRRIDALAPRHPNKLVLPIAIGELGDGEQQGQHFDRSVYLRLYKELRTQYLSILSDTVGRTSQRQRFERISRNTAALG